jgi:PAS domain-containing protein
MKGMLKAFLPGVYLAAILTLDRLTDLGTITPFCVVIALLVMAVSYPPKLMIFWCVILTAAVCALFLIPTWYIYFSHRPYFDQYVYPLIRAATYVAVGTLASYLCITLDRFWKSESELKSILKNLPWPIMISDHNGKIIYFNALMEQLIPELSQRQMVATFFYLMAEPDFQGRTIADYMKRFEHPKLDLPPMELSIHGIPRRGRTQLMKLSGKQVMLTVLE